MKDAILDILAPVYLPELKATMSSGYYPATSTFFTYATETPGYTYTWNPCLYQWVLKYTPVQGVYSPPVLDIDMQWHHIVMPEGFCGFTVAHQLESLMYTFPEGMIAYTTYRTDVGKGVLEVWSQSATVLQQYEQFVYAFIDKMRQDVSTKLLVTSLKCTTTSRPKLMPLCLLQKQQC